MTVDTKMLYHGDGCDTPMDGGMVCPKCGIPPDMQSTYFGPTPSRDLVPLDPNSLEEAWAWNSPSPYWRVTKVQPVHQTGRHSINVFKMLLIEFTHEKKDKDRIIVEGYISNKEDLRRLGPFLDAAVELPKGIRIRAHTMEHVYWDNAKPPR